MPYLLDLPGPSRRIRVEPLRLPDPARRPAPTREHDGSPAGDPAEREPQPSREREREPTPA